MQSNAISADWGNSGGEVVCISLIGNREVQLAARFGLRWKDRGEPTLLSRREIADVDDLCLWILSCDVASKRIYGGDSFAAHRCACGVGYDTQRKFSDSCYAATREEDIARCIDACYQAC
jgi:hypothetical protein